MRRLMRYKTASILLCGLAAVPASVAAQQGRVRITAEGAPARPAAAEQRPEPEPLHVEATSPELDAVLQEWFAKTQAVRKLQGTHYRWKYDSVFGVVKVAKGSFYYEGPDQGRIDVEPLPQKTPTLTNANVTYQVKPDQPERWVCDGKQILKIDDVAKTYEVLPIPPEHQGANIMDGPLPFLFGMPPDKAKKRYAMKLQDRSATEILLEVRPKQRGDAANWQRADVKLDAKTYLPTAIRLLDPAGNGETVFMFQETQVNPSKIIEIFKGDPFKPLLFGYKPVQTSGPAPIQPLTTQGKPLEGMPSVVGMKNDAAKMVLAQRGFRTVSVKPGPRTDKPELSLCVAKQSPEPGVTPKPGESVQLLLYVTDEDMKKYNLKSAER